MKIQVDTDDPFVSCLSIPYNQLPAEFLNWLEALEPYEYMDTSDLQEHMYSMDTLHEKLGERTEFDSTLDEIAVLMAEYNCAYFRITRC